MIQVRHLSYLGVLVLVALMVFRSLPTPTLYISGPMSQDIYLWQRDWNEQVKQSIETHAHSFQSMIVLHGEVSWDKKREPLARVELDFDTLKKTETEIGVALRIGNFAGPFEEEDDRTQWLIHICQSLLAEANHHTVEISELHIDFDCAESKLDGYRTWLEVIREAISPTPLTMTALPSWLDQPSFESLIQHVDSYVLQVHSITPPTSPGQPVSLCNPQAARRAVENAGKFGVPFRVALPTYGYLMAFDDEGDFVGISAETLPRHWTNLSVVEEAWSDPQIVASLVQDWSERRPASMEGVIWFRLPVGGDRMNWPWQTLNAVMQGRTPNSNLICLSQSSENGLSEVLIKNKGESLELYPQTVTVTWQTANLVSGDGLNGYRMHSSHSNEMILTLGDTFQSNRLKPGTHKSIGWFRLNKPSTIKIHVHSSH